MARADFILDSSVVIDVVLKVPAAVQWLQRVQGLRAAVTTITIMEVLQGARNKSELAKLGRELAAYQHLPTLRQDSE